MLDSVMATTAAPKNFDAVMTRVASALKLGGHFIVVSGAITIDKVGVFANPAYGLKVLHLSELPSEKNEEQKINLIIIEKVNQPSPQKATAGTEGGASAPAATQPN
jgi:hypothetical protein